MKLDCYYVGTLGKTPQIIADEAWVADGMPAGSRLTK